MSTTLPIPGGTAVLRSPGSLNVRQRRLIETAAIAAGPILLRMPDAVGAAVAEAASDGMTDEEKQKAVADALGGVRLDSLSLTRAEADAMLELQDATIVAFLESWTLPQPLPTMDTIGDLTPDVYDALAEATRTSGAQVAQTSFDPSPDPGSPTSPSSGSDGGLRATT